MSTTINAVRQLYDAGRGRNEIAKELGISAYQVDKACKALGIEWGDKAPRLAVQVRSRRAAEQRATIAQKLRDVAERELTTVLESPGMEPVEARAHMTTAAIAVQRELEMVASIAEHGAHNEHDLADIRHNQLLDSLTSTMGI